MSCPHGCEDGFLIVGDAARPCACLTARRRAKPEYSPKLGVYAPAGVSGKIRRREAARLAGRASGRARRARSPKRRRMGRQAALALKYPIRRVSRASFEQRYRNCCDQIWGIRFHQAGCDTAWELYQADRRLFDACGQDCLTTNAQRSAALSTRRRPRCRRTVQMTRRRLGEMGLETYYHVKRSGPLRIPGQLDCLRLRMLSPAKDCTPPSGTPSIPSGLDDGVFTSTAKSLDCAASRHVPPDGGDPLPAAAPPMSDEEIQRRLAGFHQLKLELGYGGPSLELSPYLRRQRLDRRYATGTSANAAATASTTWRGDR